MRQFIPFLLLILLLLPSGIEAAPPMVGTLPVVYLSSDESIVGLSIGATGGWKTEEWGVEYGKSPGGYTDEVLFFEEIEQVTLKSLQPGTAYYYRSKARSRDGWGYGEERQFTTMPLGSFWKQWRVVEDVWVGWNGHEWYMKQGPVIFVGYSCLVDVACGGGFRFEADIPKGASIDGAYLRFKASGSQLGFPTTKLRISGDGSSFSDTDNYFGRERLASLDWDEVVMFEDGKSYQSPDISSLVQEVVGLEDFVIFWDDHDDRSVRGNPRMADQRVVYSDSTVLEVEWSLPEVDEEEQDKEGGFGPIGIIGFVVVPVLAAGLAIFVRTRK